MIVIHSDDIKFQIGSQVLMQGFTRSSGKEVLLGENKRKVC